MIFVEMIFWISVLLLVHTYFIFNLTLPIIAEKFSHKRKLDNLFELPTVSLVISAYNEEEIIEEKILNSLAIDYPKEKLQILIGSDGSIDKTSEILARYNDQITVFDCKENKGKAAMLNNLVKLATGEVLVFSDANTYFFKNVIKRITQPFQNKDIGCVCGHLILTDSGGSSLGEGETNYWNIESEIKKFEGMLNVLVGANGALYAIRKKLYSSIPTKKSIMDDFFVTTKVLEKGYGSTFLSSAIGTEQTSKHGSGEFLRKIRIGRANFNYLGSYLKLLNPFRPIVAYFFFSHKLIRWFSPILLLISLFANIALFIISDYKVYIATLSIQIIFYILALFGLVLKKTSNLFITAPHYFFSMNAAFLIGFVQSFLPEKSGGWQRIERGDV